jgi:UDP-glucose 4-epimerase
MNDRVFAITGISGYLGSNLLPVLRKNFSKSLIVGIDIKKPNKNEKMIDHFYERDIRNQLEDIFVKHHVTDVIHLAWTVKPIHNKKKAYSIDIDGTLNVLQESEAANIEYFLHTSSTLSYGAHQDNDFPLTENSPLRGNKEFHYSYHKKLVEEKIEDFILTKPRIKIGIIRPSSFLGSDMDNYITRILSGGLKTFFMLPYPDGKTPIQWSHVDDIIDAYLIMIKKRLEGKYNATTDTTISMKEIPKLLEGRGIRLPYATMKWLLWIEWKLRISEAPPSYLDFVKYPFVATSKKLQEHGFDPKFTSKETILAIKK